MKIKKIEHQGMIHSVLDAPFPGTLAEYILLKKEMMKRDDSYVLSRFKNGKQLIFNTVFIEKILDKYNELHCEYCGKELKLVYWFENPKMMFKNIMATADHFFPKSLDKDLLSYNEKNLVISCHSCNQIKDNDIIPIEDVKYPYLHTIDYLREVKGTLFNN